MLDLVNVENILFLDIETVPQYERFDQMDDGFKELWEKKSKQFRSELQSAADVYQQAGIYAEFGKIICISCGFFTIMKGRVRVFRVKSFYGDEELDVLERFYTTINNFNNFIFCAHNGKEFDFPYISRRLIINKLRLPRQLNNHGKKPWDIQHLDTMELWKFGDYKSYTSLNTLAKIFNLPSSKEDIDGSQVYDVYYKEKDLKRIVKYCEKDMITVARVFQSLRGDAPLADDEIEFVK